MSRIRTHNGVGAPSIMLIIVVLTLTTFGVLTLVSARADSNLTARAVETAKAYYIADAAAQKRIREVDAALSAGQAPDTLVFLTASEETPDAYAFLCETGDGRAIRVLLRCADRDARCVILSYQLVHLTDWSERENLLLASPEN